MLVLGNHIAAIVEAYPQPWWRDRYGTWIDATGRIVEERQVFRLLAQPLLSANESWGMLRRAEHTPTFVEEWEEARKEGRTWPS